ncbi:MAG: hypothetical protein ACYDIE_08625 [Candidatus Krumholzibacteriia bacterium]
MVDGRARAAVPWLLGFALVANVYLLPGSAASPRLTDILGLLLTLWLVRRLAGRGVAGAPLAALAVLVAPVAVWTVLAAVNGLSATMLLGARWLLAVPWGLALAEAAAAPTSRRRLAWGLWWGLAANVAVLVVQNFGLLDLTARLGLAARDSVLSDLDQFWRYPGMHGHANASAAVISLLAPVSLYLYLAEGAPLWTPVAGALLLLAGGHITSSRSPLIIALLVSLTCGAFSRRPVATLRIGATLGAVVLPLLLWLGPPGGQVRWEDQGNVAINSGERLASNRIGLALIAERPFGRGVEASAEALSDALDNPSMHNAFLQLAAVFGLPMAAWVAWALLRNSAGLGAGPGSARWLTGALALQTLGLFFFEEHGNNPTFIVLTAWLVATTAPRGADPRGAA